MQLKHLGIGAAILVLALAAVTAWLSNYTAERAVSTVNCVRLALAGFREPAKTRQARFLGKVQPYTAHCRGGEHAVQFLDTPWTDWANYWGAGGDTSRFHTHLEQLSHHLGPNDRGIDGALIDLEYQRFELIKYNLHDPNTYEEYVRGRTETKGGKQVYREGPVLREWPAMRLPPTDKDYRKVLRADGTQACSGELIRYRTLTGICNDIFNPRMGSTGMLFARNVQFEETFPDRGGTLEQRNRHGDRLELLKPDPQVISRKLFTREQGPASNCNGGLGGKGDPEGSQCDYEKANFFNVLAAFWIQFMTHDWFGHLQEGNNAREEMVVGCSEQDAKALGCRTGDRMTRALVAESGKPGKFSHDKVDYLRRPPSTMRNNVTAWWDASQIYGHDETSRMRVKRDPADTARLLLTPVGKRAGEGERQGYLPLLETCERSRRACQPDPMNRVWRGQEATAFPDNWTIGLSFYHHVFAREHNAFVAEFRKRMTQTPDDDSGLRNPERPHQKILYREVTNDELFEVARLVIAAEIAKIHTVEWTTQLLYNEPMYRGMNANWGGIFEGKDRLEKVFQDAMKHYLDSGKENKANLMYSVFAAGPGIVGLNNRYPDISDLRAVNGGVNHFGSPFNFPEEFITVYRLHPLVPDLIEYREWQGDANKIRQALPVISTFRNLAPKEMRARGLANMALSMGRQRLGALSLNNHPAFLQNVPMPHLKSQTQAIDVAALDLIRDRERGIPRFNEFRRQYGLQSLTSFDDFIDTRPGVDAAEQTRQKKKVASLREVYGQHVCDDTKVITRTQLMTDPKDLKKQKAITDCLGHPDGTTVDNVEDLDTIVGWLSESVRPHGFAISETQFVVFILNASRRLFSDRFFTSSFRPEFYSTLGLQWVNNNGLDKRTESLRVNGREVPVSPMKRVLLRTMPELKPELDHVVNVFDPWARDRGMYYSLDWKPRPDAKLDDAFREASQLAVK